MSILYKYDVISATGYGTWSPIWIQFNQLKSLQTSAKLYTASPLLRLFVTCHFIKFYTLRQSVLYVRPVPAYHVAVRLKLRNSNYNLNLWLFKLKIGTRQLLLSW